MRKLNKNLAWNLKKIMIEYFSWLLKVQFATNISFLLLINIGLGFGMGMVDTSMIPTMGYLVDIRHLSTYGNIYAISDFASCLGFALGMYINIF